MSRRNAKIVSTAVLALLVVGACLVSLFPVIWTFLTSIKSNVDAFAMPPKWIFQPTLSNYMNVFEKQPFGKYFFDSIVVAVVSTVVIMVVGSLGAYSVTRYQARGVEMGKYVLLFRMLPPMAIVLPVFILFRTYGMLDTYPGLIMVYTGFNLPFGIWMLMGFFQNLPMELEEAALVDGCSRYRAFWKVILPLASPGIAATSILVLIQCWNEYLFALILTARNVRTLPIGASMFVQEHQILWGELTAAAILIMLPIFVAGLFVQRYLVRGLTVGALK